MHESELRGQLMDAEQATTLDIRLDHARALLAALEKGQEQKADRILEDIASLRENNLFQEVGKLTRQLHEAMTSFALDDKISELAEKEIPDAKERLNYVITMTQQSADTTLGAVEELLPLSEHLSEQSSELLEKWNRFLRKDMKFEEFRDVSSEMSEYFSSSSDGLQTIQTKLNEVLMAQSYQDITGQIIKRVINMVHEVELSMVDIIRISGSRLGKTEEEEQKSEVQLEGPAVPSLSGSETISSQDGVDDLLSSLGF